MTPCEWREPARIGATRHTAFPLPRQVADLIIDPRPPDALFACGFEAAASQCAFAPARRVYASACTARAASMNSAYGVSVTLTTPML